MIWRDSTEAVIFAAGFSKEAVVIADHVSPAIG